MKTTTKQRTPIDIQKNFVPHRQEQRWDKTFLGNYNSVIGSLVSFYLLTFAISWAVWIPLALAAGGAKATGSPSTAPINLLAVWGPGLAAMVITLVGAGPAGLRALWAQLGRWRVHPRWYLFALGFPVTVRLLARGIDWLFGAAYIEGAPLTAFGPNAPAYTFMLPALILFALPNAIGEELGWRGFALPKLQTHTSALVASLIIGLLWGIWHIPTLIVQGQSSLAIMSTVLSTVLAAILFTWLYNNTTGSLLLVSLFHAAMALTNYLLTVAPTPTEGLLSLCVVLWLVLASGEQLLALTTKQE